MELIDIMNEKNLFGSWQTDSNGKMVESIFTDKGSSHSYIQNFYEDEFFQNKQIFFPFYLNQKHYFQKGLGWKFV